VKTSAIFFPFDLFGNGGTGRGAELLADAFREMLADNRRERVPTRARAYQRRVRQQEFTFETMTAYRDWRDTARQAVRQAFQQGEFLFWVTGNHLGVLPVYDELANSDTLVIQFDAHLDIYNLTDCTEELSHGNFLLHCAGRLPPLVNVGHRELLLRPEYIQHYYRATFAASDLAIDPEPTLQWLRRASQTAGRIFLDLDCDVLDPTFFPAVTQPLPFGLSPPQLLRFLDAVWSERVMGIALSEFDPGRDRQDQGLATLVWLLEYLLLKRHESDRQPAVPPASDGPSEPRSS
jgi:arginase family enzyme